MHAVSPTRCAIIFLTEKSDYFHIILVINNDVTILCLSAYRYIINYFIRKVSNYSLSRSK